MPCNFDVYIDLRTLKLSIDKKAEPFFFCKKGKQYNLDSPSLKGSP